MLSYAAVAAKGVIPSMRYSYPVGVTTRIVKFTPPPPQRGFDLYPRRNTMDWDSLIESIAQRRGTLVRKVSSHFLVLIGRNKLKREKKNRREARRPKEVDNLEGIQVIPEVSSRSEEIQEVEVKRPLYKSPKSLRKVKPIIYDCQFKTTSEIREAELKARQPPITRRQRYLYLLSRLRSSTNSCARTLFVALTSRVSREVAYSPPEVSPQMDEQPSVSNQGLLDRLLPSKLTETADNVSSASEGVTKVTGKLTHCLEHMTEVFKNLTDQTKLKVQTAKEKTKSMSDVMFEQASSVLSTLIMSVMSGSTSIVSKVYDFFSHIIYMIIGRTKSIVIFSIINIYKLIFGFTLKGFTLLQNMLSKMWSSLKSLTTKLPQLRITPQSEFGDEESTKVVQEVGGTLFSMIAVFCNLKATPPKDWGNCQKLIQQAGFIDRGRVFCMSFLDCSMRILKKAVSRISKFLAPSHPDVSLIAGIGDDDRLKTWIHEAIALSDPSVQDRILNDPVFSAKVFELVVVGRGILMSLLNHSGSSQKLVRIVQEYLKKLTDIEVKLIHRKIAVGARYEPFCVWVSGRAGTLKTTVLQDFANKVAGHLGMTCAQPYFPISAGQSYFDGFANQPMILLDDLLCTSPAIDNSLYASFIQMKTAALFNPPFSAVENKDTFINFPLLGVTSNYSHFPSQPGIHDTEAYNRRRDFVLYFQFRDPSMTANNVFQKCPSDKIADMDHIQVFLVTDKLDASSSRIELTPLAGETTREMVVRYLMEEFKKYDQVQSELYKQRHQEIQQRLQSSAQKEGVVTLNQYIDMVKKSLDNNLESMSRWQKFKVLASSYITVEPQNDNNPFDPERTDISKVPNNVTYEPLVRENYCTGCLHELFVKADARLFDSIVFDDEEQIFFLNAPDDPNIPNYFIPSRCQQVVNGKLVPLQSCIYESEKIKDVWDTLVRYICKESSERVFFKDLFEEKSWKRYKFPIPFVEAVKRYFIDDYNRKALVKDTIRSKSMPKNVDAVIRAEQRKINNDIVVENKFIFSRATFGQKCQYVVKGIFNVVVGICKMIHWLALTIISILLVLGTMQGLWKLWTNNGEDLSGEPIESQLHPSGDFKTFKAKSSTKATAMKLMNCENQGELDTAIYRACESEKMSFEGIVRKIEKNTFYLVGIRNVGGQEEVFRGRCLGLYNKTGLVLKHYIEHFEAMGCSHIAVVLHKFAGCIKYSLNDIKYIWSESGGYGICKFPESLPAQFSDIRKYMPSESFDGNYPSNCIMLETHLDKSCQHQITSKILQQTVRVPSTPSQSGWTISQGFEYGWGAKGRCGSVLLAPTMACPLIGIHTAGAGTQKGYSELLLRETFSQSKENVVEYVVPQMSFSDDVYELEKEYLIVGELSKDKCVNQPVKTKIVPSEIQGVFPITTAPAPLARGDPRLLPGADPFYYGVVKRCDKTKEFQPEDLRLATEDLSRLIKAKVKPLRASCQKLSVKEAIEGCSIEGYDSLQMKTSEGYPWRLERPSGASDKSWLFKLGQYDDGRLRCDGVHPKLMLSLEVKEQMRKRGLVPPTYFTACLKDARIPIEKCSQLGKTRIFEISPVELTIAQRQLTLDFMAAYSFHRKHAENTVGINVDGTEWSELANSLETFSPFILTADYSGYGPRLNSSVIKAAFSIISDWYKFNNADHMLEIDVLSHEIIHGLHVAKNLVFRPVAGLPSGNAATVVLNSLCNSLYIRLAYLQLARENNKGFADLVYFSKFVLLFHNGDDLIISVKEDIIEWFNNQTLIEFFSRYNIKMTDALKSGVTRPYCSIREATYLKRAFVPHPNRQYQWLAPLEKSSVTDTANWIWRSVNPQEASLVNSEMACRLAYGHGPEFYNTVCETISNEWLQRGIVFSYPSWNLLDQSVWEGIKAPPFNYESIHNQMDPEPSAAQPSKVKDEAGNVVLDHVQPVETGVSHVVAAGFEKFSISQEKQVYQSMTDRWIMLTTAKWTTNQGVNSEVIPCMNLPFYALRNNLDSQNLQLFLTHRWFRFDKMIIKVVLNSNHFQVGQLVAYWTYGDSKKAVAPYDNVYSGMQRNCAYLNAGSSNDVELHVPFEYANSMMLVDQQCSLGCLSVRVLNPLVVTAGVANECSLTVYITFKGARFFGMVSRSLGYDALTAKQVNVEPQMDPLSALVGVQTLRSIFDSNRDNPPAPLQPPSVILQPAASFSYTDQIVEPINVLRSDPRGQTPSVRKDDEMKPLRIAEGWGFVKTVTWKTTDPSDTTLLAIDNVPIQERTEYPKFSANDVRRHASRIIPTPLALVSSMYGYWRGDILWKFRIVASKFHTARVLVGIVPMCSDDNVSLAVLKLSPCESFDITDSTEFVFRAPWYWYNGWAKCRDFTLNDHTPSRLFVKVQNPLIAIDSVSPQVYINVYCAASDNFELAVLRHPLLALADVYDVVPPAGQFLEPYNKENKVYVSWERNLAMSKDNLFAVTLYIQNVTDGWLGFVPSSVETGVVYRLNETLVSGAKYRIRAKLSWVSNKSTFQEYVIRYGVYDPALTTSNAKGLVVFGEGDLLKKAAINFAQAIVSAKNTADQAKVRYQYCQAWTVDSPWSEVYDNGKWITAPNDGDALQWEVFWRPNQVEDEFELIEAQMDTRSIATHSILDEPTPSTRQGVVTFGEETPDLKSLCRRWCMLSSVKAKLAKSSIKDIPYSFRIKINPKLRIKPADARSYDNYVREGPITLVASMYAFWRGGLRYRFVSNHSRGTIYVQHRYNIDGNNDAPYVEVRPDDRLDQTVYMTPQFSTYAHNFNVNTMFSIEVPYYQSQEMLTLSPSDTNTLNGYLYVWLLGSDTADVRIDIFYSLADDTRFSVFQGAEIMNDLSEIGNVSVTSQNQRP